MATNLFDQWTSDQLKDIGLTQKMNQYKGETPYTSFGVPGFKAYVSPDLAGTNTKGFMFSDDRLKNEMQNRGISPSVFLSPTAGASTLAHETEHLLARQNAGFPQMTRDKFNAILSKQAPFSSYEKRDDFLQGLKESLPYLKEKYGIENGYMTPEFINKQGAVGLYEIFATLAAAESTQNVDLTKDPELRKKMFNDPVVRQAYNAVTGLRQTRTDPRDIPPYTYVEETPWWKNALKGIGF